MRCVALQEPSLTERNITVYFLHVLSRKSRVGLKFIYCLQLFTLLKINTFWSITFFGDGGDGSHLPVR